MSFLREVEGVGGSEFFERRGMSFLREEGVWEGREGSVGGKWKGGEE